MLNIYNQDDSRMNDYDVKRSVIVIDDEKKRVLEYIYMIEKDTEKECVKCSMMCGDVMANTIKTATYKEYLDEYVEFVASGLCLAEKQIQEQQAVKVASRIKEIEERTGMVIARDTNGVDKLIALIDYNV